MEQIYQSAILQSLGWAIADSIWQMGLLWLIYQLFIGLPVRNKPVIRHLGSTIALFTGSIWFVVNFFYTLFTQNNADPVSLTPLTTSNPSLIQWMESLLPYLSSAYLVVVFVLMIKFTNSILLTYRLRLNEKHISPSEWQLFVDDISTRLALSRKVFIYLSEAVNVPATIGFIKPVILLPVASLNHLTVQQVEAIILHELAHIRRFDYLINLIVSFIETILFFNPFTHLFSNQIRKECELCCDDAVVNDQHDPGQYATALLMLEKNRQHYPLMLAATGKESLLLGRVKRILNQPEQKVRYAHKLAALALVAFLIVVLSLIAPVKQEKTGMTLAVTPSTYKETLPSSSGSNLPMMLKMELNEAAAFKMPSQQHAPKLTPNMKSPDRINQPVIPDHARHPDIAFSPAPPAPPLPAMPQLPPSPPPMLENQIMDLKNMQAFRFEDEPGMAFINGFAEKQLLEVFENDQTAKFIMEWKGSEEEFRRKTAEHRKASQFRKDLELNKIKAFQQEIELLRVNEMQRQNIEVLIKRGEQSKKAAQNIRTRTPKAEEPSTKFKETDMAPEAEISRSFSMNGKQVFTAPRIRKFKDERGMVISIIEAENEIRIHMSDK